MTDTQPASHGALPGAIDANGPVHVKDLKTEREPGAVVPEGQRDSGIDLSHDEEVHQDAANDEHRSTNTLSPPAESSLAMANAQEGHHDASQPAFSSQEVTTTTADDDTEAGPSRAEGSGNNTPPGDDTLIRPVPHRGESTVNAVGYRRDSETVIAFLVPLPKPTIQGSTLDIPPKYFLYVPPPPPLVKPKKGKEPYARRAHRVWQQNVRKAKVNAHNGKRVSLSALHSATIRGCIWASEKRRGADDGAVFLGRIQPKTVAHLIMIHPWALSVDQTPEEILKTFRAQITAQKKGSIVKILNRKMGPEPKTLHISPKAIIDSTRGTQDSDSSEEDGVAAGLTENEQPQPTRRNKVRASFDSAKLRNPVAAIKSQIQQRGRKRHRDGSPSAVSPDTTETVEPEATFTGGELEHYSEEEGTDDAGLVDAEGVPFTGHQLAEIPEEGFLDHYEETAEETTEAAPGTADPSGGGLFAGSSDAANGAGNDLQGVGQPKNGSRFQLTFYPSPAMDIMSRYVQEGCHMANGHAFPSPTATPTAAGVLASIGWEPERRVFADADEQIEDENWQARETEEDLEIITAKAARAWEKQCRKYVQQSRGGRLTGDKKPGRFAILVARVRPQKPAKGKTTQGQPEQPPSEKNGKASALKQRLAAIKDKRNKKQSAEEADPTQKQSKKQKAQKAAGIILFPVIVILGIPILVGKGIASGFKKVKDRRKKTDGDVGGTQQQGEAKASRRTAMKQRLSERSGSVKQGLSTRSEAIKKRLAERKAKKSNANDANGVTPTAASHDGQADAAGEGVVGNTANETRLTKKQRLVSFLVAGPLAINHMIEKRRRGTDPQTTSTNPEDATPKDKKPSRFSGGKERVKALRTKVNKQARFAKLRARLRTLQERRQNRKNVKKDAKNNDTASAPQVDEGNNETSVKRRSAMAGLAAACMALPAAKVKQVRDKRRKQKAADGVEGAAAAAREEHVTASNPPVAEVRESSSPASRPSSVRVVPSEPEMLEPAVDPFRPPENGQSEVPVQQAAQTEPEALTEGSGGGSNSSAAVAAAAAAAPEADNSNTARSAAAVRFQSIRGGLENVRDGIGSGITNLTARRRAAPEQSEAPTDETQRPQAETMDSAETRVEADASTGEPNSQPAPSQQDTATSGGRFKSIKDGIGSGIEGLKAKRQREKEAPPKGEETAATAAGEDDQRTAAANKKDTAPPAARLKALKDGIGGRRAKSGEDGASAPVKTEKSKQLKEHTHKESNSGLVDRVKWFLYAA